MSQSQSQSQSESKLQDRKGRDKTNRKFKKLADLYYAQYIAIPHQEDSTAIRNQRRHNRQLESLLGDVCVLFDNIT